MTNKMPNGMAETLLFNVIGYTFVLQPYQLLDGLTDHVRTDERIGQECDRHDVPSSHIDFLILPKWQHI